MNTSGRSVPVRMRAPVAGPEPVVPATPLRPLPVMAAPRLAVPTGASPSGGNAAAVRALVPAAEARDAPTVGTVTVEADVGGAHAGPPADSPSAPRPPAARTGAAVAVAPGSAASAPPAENLRLEAFHIERPSPVAALPALPRFAPVRWELARAPRAAEPAAAREADAARRRALGRHDQLQALARRHHAAVVARATEVQIALRASSEQVVASLPGPMARIDADLGLPLDEQLAALDDAARKADALVVTAEHSGRARIEGAYSRGSAAVAANLNSAETQIGSIVDDLAGLYLRTLESAATECLDLSTRATRQVDRWMAVAPALWPAGVGGLSEAENETKRLAARQRGTAATASLATQGANAVQSFRDQAEPTRTSIASAVDPPMRRHVTDLTEQGQQSIDDARSAARAALRTQAREARDHIEAMRIDARARVFAQRRTARAQIESTATRGGLDAQREAEAAARALGQALVPSLAAFGGALDTLRSHLDGAAGRGGATLDRTSELALRQVDGALARAERAQTERIDITLAGVESGMTRRAREVPADAEGQARDAAEAMATVANTDLPTFAATARAQTAGFALMGAGVEAATARWAQPFGEAFQTYIDEVRIELANSHRDNFVGQVTQAKQPYVNWATPMLVPHTAFAADLAAAWTPMRENLNTRAHNAGSALSSGIVDVVDENALSRALRNLTAPQGSGVRALYLAMGGRSIDDTLAIRRAMHDLDGDEYDIAIAYLDGRAREANLMELEASRGWINDDEERMREVLRSLSRDELDALHSTEGASATIDRARGVLGGTDLKVFDALNAGNPARADALLWRERLNAARVRGDVDALNDTAAEYTGAATYLGNPVTAEERRRQVVEAFAGLLREDGIAPAGGDAATAVASYATRRTDVIRSSFWSGQRIEQEELTGPGADLFGDIIRHGVGSVEARQSRIAFELGREGGPNMLRLDQALVDNRLNPLFAERGERAAEALARARADRDRLAIGFATRYGGVAEGTALDPANARRLLAERTALAFGDDAPGAAIGRLLVVEEVPSPETAGHMMRYGMTHETGTNEALLSRVTGRMNRDEIARMTASYNRGGGNLHADLGVYGRGSFGELSGDERLAMEVSLLGVPRNDRERAEVAAFTAQQQRDETGGVGSFLTSGGFQDRALAYEMAQLQALSGISVSRDAHGMPVFSGGDENFREGAYTGTRRAEFESAVSGATLAAQAYAARVDAWANFAVNAVMVVGAVLATVLTAGGAGPLLLAAVAAGTGLTAMVAHKLISGGRYGWEQALTDLGMTLVQTLTAGLGATLGLASRGGSAAVGTGLRAGLTGRIPQSLMRASMGRLTGSALGDVVLIGAATNALNMAGTTALQEQTWEKGIGAGLGEVLTGGFTGALTGGLSAGIGHGLGAIRPGRVPGLSRLPALRGSTATLGELLSEASPLARGFGQSGIGAVSGFAGRFAELGIQAGRGRYHGDAGDMLMESGEAGAMAGLQSFGEGVGEGIVDARARVRAGGGGHGGAGDGGDGGGGPPRPIPGAGPEPDSDRLFPNLADAEVHRALAEAEAGPLLRIGAEQPGADTRPLVLPDAAQPDLHQRQRAGALRDEAAAASARAEALLADAIDHDNRAALVRASRPDRADRLRDAATALLDQAIVESHRAAALRVEADEFASGRRSATADLPGPDDLDAHFGALQAEQPGLVRVPLSELERHPEMLPRLVRPLLEGEGGRVVFRVESERSRGLVTVDAAGNVRVASDAAVHLNFGSFERAVEFVLNSARGDARIIAFEVDEAWVRAARSAGIPEHGTEALAGRQPRTVDVRFGDDQLEIPASLVPELNRFIVPGSGVVHELPAGGPRRGGGPDEGGALPLPPDGERTMAGRVPPGSELPPAGTPAHAPVSPELAAANAAHDQWLQQMRASILGDGPPPPEWRGPPPQLDSAGSWRGSDPAEAYAAYRVALDEGGGRYEAIISRDRLSGEYQVMLGRQADVSPPAATPGRLWETVLHYHPNLEGALRYTLPAQMDLWQSMLTRLRDGRPFGAPHVEFVESMIDGQRTRVAIVSDDAGMRLEIGAGAAQGGRVHPITTLEDYLAFWQRQSGGTPLPAPSDPGGARWVAPGSQEHRDLMRGAAEALGHADVAARVKEVGPETRGVPVEPHTMSGTLPVAPPDIPTPAELILLRQEEHARRVSARAAAGLHHEALRVIADADEALGRLRGARDPLEAQRQPLQERLADVARRAAAARDEREAVRVPGTPGIEPEELVAFRARAPAEREALRAQAAALEAELRQLNGRRLDLERELDPLRQRLADLDRQIVAHETRRGEFEALRERSATELANHERRLVEIAARRAVAGGDFHGEYRRLGESPPCFAAGTLVHTPDGVRPIERLGRDSVVRAFDTVRGMATQRRVLRAEPGHTQRLCDIAVAGETLSCTPLHRFWIPEQGVWQPAQALQPGWTLLGCDGTLHPIDSVSERFADVPTYNLLVEREHNYFVGRAGLLTHNGKESGELPKSRFRDEIEVPPEPFIVRYYVIVHVDAPDTLIYVGSTVKPIEMRLFEHIEERSYRRGPKAGLAWADEAGADTEAIVLDTGGLEVQRGPFIVREVMERQCRSNFERFVWELYLIERFRRDAAETMQNDFSTPPIGQRRFEQFLDAYLAQLCAAR